MVAQELVIIGVLFLSTMIGAIPVYALRYLKPRGASIIDGFCAGAMLGATFLSLVVPAFNIIPSDAPSFGLNVLIAILTLILGYISIHAFHNSLPHEHESKGVEGVNSRSISRMWLIASAVAIHNLPEGFAVGIGTHTLDSAGLSLLSAIALQNIPEGFIVAAALRLSGAPTLSIVRLTGLTAIIEVIGALIGIFAVHIFHDLLPYGLAFAAGAMLFVVCREMIPECYKKDEQGGSLGIIIGVCAILALRAIFN